MAHYLPVRRSLKHNRPFFVLLTLCHYLPSYRSFFCPCQDVWKYKKFKMFCNVGVKQVGFFLFALLTAILLVMTATGWFFSSLEYVFQHLNSSKRWLVFPLLSGKNCQSSWTSHHRHFIQDGTRSSYTFFILEFIGAYATQKKSRNILLFPV